VKAAILAPGGGLGGKAGLDAAIAADAPLVVDELLGEEERDGALRVEPFLEGIEEDVII
jgi:hypothetical protein